MKQPPTIHQPKISDRTLRRLLVVILVLALALLGMSSCKAGTFGGSSFDLPTVTAQCEGKLDQENSASWIDPTSEQAECVRHNTGMPDAVFSKLFVETPYLSEAEAQWTFDGTNLSAYVRPDGESRRFGLYIS